MDIATIAIVLSALAAGTTLYAAITGARSAKATVSREDWVASKEQDRKDRVELREANDELKADNADLKERNTQLESTSKALAVDNYRLHADLDDVKGQMADLRSGLTKALTHVENCEAELQILKGQQ